MTRNIQLLGNDFEGFWKTPNENIYYIKKLKLFIANKIATVFHLIVKQKLNQISCDLKIKLKGKYNVAFSLKRDQAFSHFLPGKI